MITAQICSVTMDDLVFPHSEQHLPFLRPSVKVSLLSKLFVLLKIFVSSTNVFDKFIHYFCTQMVIYCSVTNLIIA